MQRNAGAQPHLGARGGAVLNPSCVASRYSLSQGGQRQTNMARQTDGHSGENKSVPRKKEKVSRTKMVALHCTALAVSALRLNLGRRKGWGRKMGHKFGFLRSHVHIWTDGRMGPASFAHYVFFVSIFGVWATL